MSHACVKEKLAVRVRLRVHCLSHAIVSPLVLESLLLLRAVVRSLQVAGVANTETDAPLQYAYTASLTADSYTVS